MPAFRSLLYELALCGADALLGEDAAHLLARFAAIVCAVLAGWIGYRLLTALIRRLLQPLMGATDYPARAQRAGPWCPCSRAPPGTWWPSWSA